MTFARLLCAACKTNLSKTRTFIDIWARSKDRVKNHIKVLRIEVLNGDWLLKFAHV